MILIDVPGRHDGLCNSCYEPSSVALRVWGDDDTGGRSVFLCKECAHKVAEGILGLPEGKFYPAYKPCEICGNGTKQLIYETMELEPVFLSEVLIRKPQPRLLYLCHTCYEKEYLPKGEYCASHGIYGVFIQKEVE